MQRNNHYEAAFEAYLQWHGIGYVAVDESRRTLLGDMPLKSLDFIVFGGRDAGFLVDIKGRRFPAGPPSRPRRTWESWCTEDDVAGLESWSQRFGSGFRGLLVFAYLIAPDVPLLPETEDLWKWRERRYLFRAVAIDDYRTAMRVRSPRWHTFDVPVPAFRDIVHPLSYFTKAGAGLSAGCPF
jgi:hypothetical protein